MREIEDSSQVQLWENRETITPNPRRKRPARRPVRRMRRLFLPALTLMMGTLALSVGSAVARRNGPPPEPPILSMTVPITVEPGDNLWSIASRYGNPNTHIVERVDALAEENGMSADARLYPGHRLLVQVENPTELARLQAEQQTRIAAVRQYQK